MPYLTISPVEGRLDVQTEWSDKELIKDIPGTYWDGKRKTWHCPRTVAAVYQMRGTFGARLDYSDEVEAWLGPEKQRLDYARYLARLVEPDDGAVVDGLYPWQVVDYRWAWTVIGPGGRGPARQRPGYREDGVGGGDPGEPAGRAPGTRHLPKLREASLA